MVSPDRFRCLEVLALVRVGGVFRRRDDEMVTNRFKHRCGEMDMAISTLLDSKNLCSLSFDNERFYTARVGIQRNILNLADMLAVCTHHLLAGELACKYWGHIYHLYFNWPKV